MIVLKSGISTDFHPVQRSIFISHNRLQKKCKLGIDQTVDLCYNIC